MKIKFHKPSSQHLHKYQKYLLRAAFKYAVKYHDLVNKEHTVRVYFDSEVDYLGEFELLSMKQSRITVKSDRPTISMCSTVFHEITHLKQYLKYDICFTAWGRTWRGAPIAEVKDDHSYWTAPYEVDARLHERKMLYSWLLFFWR